MIKGWIAENKGNVVNWAKVIIGTTQEKARCVNSSYVPRALGESQIVVVDQNYHQV